MPRPAAPAGGYDAGPMPPVPRFVDLGAGVPYAAAYQAQEEANLALQAGTGPETVFWLEHADVITTTPKAVAGGHVLHDAAALARLGVELAETNRGGDVTWHGPGQLVGYFILDLHARDLSLSAYMRWLEDLVIATLAEFGVAGQRESGATGVWVDLTAHGLPARPGERGHLAKVCAMGVRIRKGTTLHGIALNIAPNLARFGLIVPCGLAGRPVTSLAELLGARAPTMEEVKRVMQEEAAARLA